MRFSIPDEDPLELDLTMSKGCKQSNPSHQLFLLNLKVQDDQWCLFSSEFLDPMPSKIVFHLSLGIVVSWSRVIDFFHDVAVMCQRSSRGSVPCCSLKENIFDIIDIFNQMGKFDFALSTAKARASISFYYFLSKLLPSTKLLVAIFQKPIPDVGLTKSQGAFISCR